jgi:hypothetical protein
VVWLGVLSFYLRRTIQSYNVFTQGTHKKTLEGVLTTHARDLHVAKKDIAALVDRCATIEDAGKLHIQKVGLLRFNPFKDTGGDQSFVLALVDAHDSGVVITALYSRLGTRWYAKQIVEGKGLEHELSEEEKKSLKVAKEIKS